VLFSAQYLAPLGVGLVVAFASAFIVIRWLIRYVATHDFRPFAWYRIVFGVAVLLAAYFGWVSWSAA
jgi:undecaprenyl-diphosphatase